MRPCSERFSVMIPDGNCCARTMPPLRYSCNWNPPCASWDGNDVIKRANVRGARHSGSIQFVMFDALGRVKFL